MAVTATLVGIPVVPGASYQKLYTLTADNSYPNPAGYVLTPATFGFSVLKKIVDAIPATVAAGKWEIVLVPTYASDGSMTSVALHLIVSTTGVEVANGVDTSTFVGTLIVEGN